MALLTATIMTVADRQTVLFYVLTLAIIIGIVVMRGLGSGQAR